MGHGTYVLVDENEQTVVRRLRPWQVLMARLQAGTLDQELARGDSPESCEYLGVRAQQLTSARYRRMLAASLRRMLAEADGPRGNRRFVPRKQIATAADELAELAERLCAPGPVPVRGVAMACELLREGTGPLYRDGGPGALRYAVTRVIGGLAEYG
jgi:hypothetical protein